MNLDEVFDGGEYGLFAGKKLYERAQPKDYLVEHILYERDVICISSKPGIGKSILAKQLMCCMTSGTPFLETYKVARPMNVLYVQTEGDRAETLERLELMTTVVPIDNRRWAHFNLPGVAFNVKSEFDAFVASVQSIGMVFDVVIIDPLYTTIKGDMSKNEVATDWIRAIRWLKGYLDCAIIILNHEGKDLYNEGVVVDRGTDSIFGSTFWGAFFNHNYKLKLYDGHHIMEIGKNRSGKAVDRIVMSLVNTDTLMYVPYDPAMTENGYKVKNAIKGGQGVDVRTIIDVTGVSRATIYRVLKKIEDEGNLKKEVKGIKVVYHWQEAPTGEAISS